MFAKANNKSLERKSLQVSMYRALYKALKGNTLLKILQLIALAAAVIAILFLFVFPYLDSTFAEDPNLNG
jgi:quinol-cytochrome oxidoreductase complex cytochrome b subunit